MSEQIQQQHQFKPRPLSPQPATKPHATQIQPAKQTPVAKQLPAAKQALPAKAKVHKRRDNLSMDIYSAMLGNAPQIEPHIDARPRLTMKVRVEAKLHHAGLSPFYRPTLREHVERCAAYAAKAIDEARARIAESKPGPMAKISQVPPMPGIQPIALIGPAALRSVRTRAEQTSPTTRAA